MNVGVQLKSYADLLFLKLGVDINVGLDKEGLVLVMYVGVGLVLVWSSSGFEGRPV